MTFQTLEVWFVTGSQNLYGDETLRQVAEHHTVFSQALTSEPIEDFAEMAGVECLRIDQQTELREFKNQLRLAPATGRRS